MAIYTVKELYTLAKEQNKPLLSDYGGDFWAEYNADFASYDSLFNRMFSSFVYFNQSGTEELTDVLANFTQDVYIHLLTNRKKFGEIYKIHLNTNDINIFDDVYIKETRKDENSKTTTDEIGAQENSNKNSRAARTDTLTDTIGARTNDETGYSHAYNNNRESIDRRVTIKDASATDTHKTAFGADIFTITDTTGARTDTHTETETRTGETLREGATTANPYDNAKKFFNFWRDFNFYDYVFKDISAELLNVGCVV